MALSSASGGCASSSAAFRRVAAALRSPEPLSPSGFPPTNLRLRKFGPIRATTAEAPVIPGGIAPAITLTEKALNHLTKMRAEKNEDLCLRIGVRQGGCSGMSYTMEFENRSNSREDDSIIEYNGFTIVCDPKSLLFLYGMQLDFSDALIGGGFNFQNPNATKTCGCGKSFASGMQKETETVGSCNDV